MPSSLPRRRKPNPNRSFAPSSSISSLLATFAATSGIDAFPLFPPQPPPTFLCPFIGSEVPFPHCAQPKHTQRAKLQEPLVGDLPTDPPPEPRHHWSKRATIPYRYQQGPDGSWSRVQEYTLYGSTVCLHCLTASTSTSEIAIPTDTSSSMSPMSEDIIDQLPNGWKPSDTGRGSRTSLILALSLALAFFICFFVTTCVIWRKARSRTPKVKDEEMELSERTPPTAEAADEADALVEREGKVNRHWSRATARWKANARLLARQRRGNRRASRQTGPRQTASDVHPVPTSSSPPPRISPSSSTHELTRRPSTSSRLSRQANPLTLEDVLHTPPFPPPSPPPPPTPPLATTAPPAYHPGTVQSLPSTSKSPGGYIPTSHQPNHATHFPCPLADPTSPEDPVSAYRPSFYTAHVATDDKALMARMAALASAPPIGPAAGDEPNVQASVPIWEDEELEEYDDPPPADQRGEGSHSSPFPLPPPQFSHAYHYDIPYDDLDVDTLEGEMGPSAPPFEVACAHSAPSAPPLHEDEDGTNSSAGD